MGVKSKKPLKQTERLGTQSRSDVATAQATQTEVDKRDRPRGIFSYFLETPPRTQRRKRRLQCGSDTILRLSKQTRSGGLLKRAGLAHETSTAAPHDLGG